MYKEKLLETGYFEDNEYFDLYLNLILENKDTKAEKFITQKHHIIPRHYYSHNNLTVDNSNDNLVNLKYADHMLAHIYLSGCTKGKDKYWNLYSVFYMSNKTNINIDDITKNLSFYQELYTQALTAAPNHRKCTTVSEETLKKMRLAQKSRREKYGATNKNYIWVNNSYKDYMIPREELDLYLSDGFYIGRLFKHSEETKSKIGKHAKETRIKNGSYTSEEYINKIRTAQLGKKHSEESKLKMSLAKKGKMVGDKNPFYGKKHSEESKEKNRVAHIGRKWINNGDECKMVFSTELSTYLDSGWKIGRIKKNK